MRTIAVTIILAVVFSIAFAVCGEPANVEQVREYFTCDEVTWRSISTGTVVIAENFDFVYGDYVVQGSLFVQGANASIHISDQASLIINGDFRVVTGAQASLLRSFTRIHLIIHVGTLM